MTTNAQIASGNACQFFIAQYPRSFQQIALLQKNRNALIRPAIGIGNTFQRRQVNDQYRIDNVMPNLPDFPCSAGLHTITSFDRLAGCRAG